MPIGPGGCQFGGWLPELVRIAKGIEPGEA